MGNNQSQPETADATRCPGCGSTFGLHRIIIDGQTYHPSCAPSANYEIRALKSRVEELTKALETAHEAIKSLPEEALGYGTVEHADGSGIAYQYPLQSEVLSVIEKVLDAEGSPVVPLEGRGDAT